MKDGDFSLQNIINTGIHTTFKNKKNTVGFLYGKNNNSNNWMQSGLTSAVTNEYASVTGFKFGTGTGSAAEQFVAVNLYQFRDFSQTAGMDGSSGLQYMAVSPRKDATITFHSGIPLSGKHQLTVDISRSFGAYSNNIQSDSTVYKSNAHEGVFSNAGIANYAGMVEYRGEVAGSDVKMFVKKVGLGYNNPGNILLRSGENQLGLGFARKFMRNLTTRYSFDVRKQLFDPSKKFSQTTVNNKIQLAYRINRNNRVGFAYQRSDYNGVLAGQGKAGGQHVRLQLDGGYSVCIAGRKITNTANISHQQLSVPVFDGTVFANKSFTVTHSSTAVINKNVLSLLLLLNKADNNDYLFNTSMFTSEMGYSYTLTQQIRLGSNLGYYSNAGWNRQIGCRQQVSATLFEQLNIDLDVSYKKAISIIRTELADQLFISAGMHFNF